MHIVCIDSMYSTIQAVGRLEEELVQMGLFGYREGFRKVWVRFGLGKGRETHIACT